MPVTPTYPGVYLEELPSAVHTITAVSTSVTAFVGYTPSGPLETPQTLTSFADFERTFGGLSANSVLSYAVQHFFLNGGATAIVVRVASGATPATKTLASGTTDVMTVTARNPGVLGRSLRLAVGVSTDDTLSMQVFDLTGALNENYQGLSMTSTDANFAGTIINAGSSLITVKVLEAELPDPSGTVSRAFTDPLPDLAKEITVSIGSVTSGVFKVYDSDH